MPLLAGVNSIKDIDSPMKFFIFIAMVVTANLTLADYVVQGTSVKCADTFVVEKNNLVNSQPKSKKYQNDDGSWVMYWSEEHAATCKVNGYDIKAKVKGREARAKGACGSSPGSNLNLIVNGVEVLQYSLMNNWCYQSLDRVEIDGDNITICGHSGHDKNKGCFSNSLEDLIKIGLPLSPFPINKLLSNK